MAGMNKCCSNSAGTCSCGTGAHPLLSADTALICSLSASQKEARTTIRIALCIVCMLIMHLPSHRGDSSMQSWWQQLHEDATAAWFADGLKALVHAHRSSSPGSASDLSQRVTLTLVPGPPLLPGQIASIQHCLHDSTVDAALQALCSSISASMTVQQVRCADLSSPSMQG